MTNGCQAMVVLLGLLFCFGSVVTAGADRNTETQDEWAGTNQMERFVRGCRYLRGDDIAQDDEKAIALLMPLAKGGHSEAQYMIGKCYVWGVGVTRDPEQAVYWYRKAARQKHLFAAHTMGEVYRGGLGGMPVDLLQAMRWHVVAWRAGKKESFDILLHITKYLLGAVILASLIMLMDCMLAGFLLWETEDE